MFSVDSLQHLNELEMVVYQYVIQHQRAIPYMRIRELAAEAHVSTTTILRFCKKMGCDGYAEFKLRMKEAAVGGEKPSVPEDLTELKAFLERMESQGFQERLDEAASLIARADRVICVGVSNSGYVAQYAARYFSSFGKFSMALTDPYYPAWQLKDAATTVAVVFSVSGEVSQTIRIANQLKRLGAHLLAITNSENSTVARLSELAIAYYVTMRRGSSDVDFSHPKVEDAIDYTTQAPALIVAETLARRVARRLSEE